MLRACAVPSSQILLSMHVMARTVQGFKDVWFVVISFLLLVSLSFAVCVCAFWC